MVKLFAVLSVSLFYMEMIYHFASFGFSGFNPVLLLPACICLAGVECFLVVLLRGKGSKAALWVVMALNFVLFAAQLVYMQIFRQPLLIAAVQNGGKQAMENYWREALEGILASSGYLLLLALPFAGAGILLHFKIVQTGKGSLNSRLGALAVGTGGAALFTVMLFIGFKAEAGYYEDYYEFYDPGMSIEQYGVLASMQRDMSSGMIENGSSLEPWKDGGLPEENGGAGDGNTGGEQENGNGEGGNITDGDSVEEETQTPELPDNSPNVMAIDFDKLNSLADSDDVRALAQFMQSMEPTKRNEYTGMFEGYNLIYLTAEGFSPYAVDENVTPTLYKMIHSGFVFNDYYVPLWQTSTSDGEYVNCTGLIPDQQFSFKRSASIAMPYALPGYFGKEGVTSYAYHNNTLSYYDRNLSHPNLGYDFKASKLGGLPEAEWASKVFPMENADFWPASDLDMMKATVPEYINSDRFHAYYMTVSGHMNYNFKGNRMSSMNMDAVAGLPYSEEGRAYIACNVELDKALAYLIEQLEAAGKLDNTVICLSTDHYPYGMQMPTLEELAGKPLQGTLELYRNNLILWNSKMETVEVAKTCSAIDILPTLLNLFGFEYDSRLYAGKDILSDSPPLVVFSDRSFITDKVIYNRKAKTTESRTEEPVDEAYFTEMKKKVKGIYEYSAGILNQDFYRYVEQAVQQ